MSELKMSPVLALGWWKWLRLGMVYSKLECDVFFETFDCYGYSSVVMPLMKCNSKDE